MISKFINIYMYHKAIPYFQKDVSMPAMHLIHPSSIPSCQLEDWGPVVEPVGSSVAHVRGCGIADVAGHLVNMGVWECSPGMWRRQVMLPELAHIIAGRARFYPDRGQPLDIRAGDLIWFPRNTKGTWEVIETLRKTYILVEPSYVRAVLRSALRGIRDGLLFFNNKWLRRGPLQSRIGALLTRRGVAAIPDSFGPAIGRDLGG